MACDFGWIVHICCDMGFSDGNDENVQELDFGEVWSVKDGLRAYELKLLKKSSSVNIY